MVELHSTVTIDGSKTIVDGVYPINHAEHETRLLTASNDWFECGFYIFTSISEAQSSQWGGGSDPAARCSSEEMALTRRCELSNEIGCRRRQYSVDTWTSETSPIVDQKVDRWYWS
jgi:hypothetical protein